MIFSRTTVVLFNTVASNDYAWYCTVKTLAVKKFGKESLQSIGRKKLANGGTTTMPQAFQYQIISAAQSFRHKLSVFGKMHRRLDPRAY